MESKSKQGCAFDKHSSFENALNIFLIYFTIFFLANLSLPFLVYFIVLFVLNFSISFPVNSVIIFLLNCTILFLINIAINFIPKLNVSLYDFLEIIIKPCSLTTRRL